jgi:predicted esterase
VAREPVRSIVLQGNRSMKPAISISCACVILAFAASDTARADGNGSGSRAPAWCAPETETLSDSICHFDGNEPGRRTLVVFLHGLVPKSSTWQWMQQRAILREARQFHFATIMPKAPGVGPNASAGYMWPGTRADEATTQPLVDSWIAAQHALEARAGRPFDEVFVIGFSAGAYFATSIALRDRLKADGFVLLAGGSPLEPSPEVQHQAPIFVGISSRDRATAPPARALGAALAAHAWPHRMDEEPVGHMVSDLHVAHALVYLRRLKDAPKDAPKAR